jgi:MFS family permease
MNNRWFQLVASLIAMIMIANLQYAWTLFVGPLREANGWELSDVQWAFTLFILFQTWVQPLDGWLIDRWPLLVHQRLACRWLAGPGSVLQRADKGTGCTCWREPARSSTADASGRR